MTLEKGDIIKQIKRNEREEFSSTVANSELTYKVVRVNSKTYSLQCIHGYMKGTKCNLLKSFQEKSSDVYGTITEWILV